MVTPEAHLSLFGKIPDFDKKIATFRKYGISSDIIIQSLAQLRKMYEDNIGLIVGNCNIIICLGTTDKEDSEFFSELLGQKTVETISHSFDNKGIFVSGNGGNYSVDGENLMRPEDVRGMKPDECLVFISTQNPFKAKKYPATVHPNYKFMYDDHKDQNNPDEWVEPFEYQRIFKVTPAERQGITAADLDPTLVAAKQQAATPQAKSVKPHKSQNTPQRYTAVDIAARREADMLNDLEISSAKKKDRMIDAVTKNMDKTVIDGNVCVALESVKNTLKNPEFVQKLQDFANKNENVDENGVLNASGFIADEFDSFF